MEMSDEQIERLADAVAARISQDDGLITLQDFAERRGVKRRVVYKWRDRYGFAIRDASGAKKEKGDRSTSYVYLPEVKRKEEMHERSVANGVRHK